MKNIKNLSTIGYCFFLMIIVVIFAYINSQKILEKFTPGIRQIYRPYMRQARITYNNLYDNTTARASNLFRQIGLI